MDTIKILTTFASKDETRYYLNGIYRGDDYFVSTDGHRLFQVKPAELPYDHFKAGFIYESKAFELGAVKVIDGKYPETKMLIPDITVKDADTGKAFYTQLKVDIPAWFKTLKTGKKFSELPKLGLTASGDFTTSAESLVHFNASLLSPLAGLKVNAFVKGPVDPVVILPSDCTSTSDAPWLSLIMPLRGPQRPEPSNG